MHPPTYTILFDRQDLSAASSGRRRSPLLRHGATLVALLLVCIASPASHASPHVKASAWTRLGGIPGVVAHRGGSSLAPENTLAAYRAAIGRGDRAVECDVHLSADGVPVVIHDPKRGRTTDGRGLVRRRSLRSLRRLDAGGWWSGAYQGESVPTLEEVLDIAKNRAVESFRASFPPCPPTPTSTVSEAWPIFSFYIVRCHNAKLLCTALPTDRHSG